MVMETWKIEFYWYNKVTQVVLQQEGSSPPNSLVGNSSSYNIINLM